MLEKALNLKPHSVPGYCILLDWCKPSNHLLFEGLVTYIRFTQVHMKMQDGQHV